MISKDIKQKYLKQVTSSEEFSHSNRSQELLNYLVKAENENRELDEITIAEEFFHKGPKFDPHDDASIRVYISQLRKRLANYYKEEGVQDSVKICIQKGYYSVKFIEVTKSTFNINQIKNKKLILPFITALLTLFLIISLMQNNYLKNRINIMPKDNAVWTDFFNSDKPTILVLGDYFFMYYHRNKDRRLIGVRDPSINSPEEYRQIHSSSTDSTLKPLTYTYLRPNSIWGIYELLPIIKTFGSPFHIKLASEMVWEDISSHNIIFIGTYKTLYILKPLLDKINVKFSNEVDAKILSIYDSAGNEIQQFKHSMDFRTRKYDDYGLISKIKGTNDNNILLITGFDEGGVIKSSKLMANSEFVEKLVRENAKNYQPPFTFRIVLGIEGFQRSDLNMKIEYFDLIE
ncbi:MAG: hypothetical protein JXQ65_11000 [Candidatus Marinimicrobia bacterium]|nr:hypothetical protein [Candidatus Neomarinimicrobiota bacterium]